MFICIVLVGRPPPKTQAEGLPFWMSAIVPFTYSSATYMCGISFRPPKTEDIPRWRRSHWTI